MADASITITDVVRFEPQKGGVRSGIVNVAIVDGTYVTGGIPLAAETIAAGMSGVFNVTFNGLANDLYYPIYDVANETLRLFTPTSAAVVSAVPSNAGAVTDPPTAAEYDAHTHAVSGVAGLTEIVNTVALTAGSIPLKAHYMGY